MGMLIPEDSLAMLWFEEEEGKGHSGYNLAPHRFSLK